MNRKKNGTAVAVVALFLGYHVAMGIRILCVLLRTYGDGHEILLPCLSRCETAVAPLGGLLCKRALKYAPNLRWISLGALWTMLVVNVSITSRYLPISIEQQLRLLLHATQPRNSEFISAVNIGAENLFGGGITSSAANSYLRSRSLVILHGTKVYFCSAT